MKTLADCEECRAILEEFRNSLDEVESFKSELDANAETMRRFLTDEIQDWPPQPLQQDGGDFLEALHKELHVPPFASRFSNPRYPKFARAMQRMLAHYQRTAHWTSVRSLLTRREGRL